VGKGNQEETTLKTNIEAAKEVVRQLRLRNIGGIIIIDFIDMRQHTNKQALMHCLQEELRKRDKLKSVTLNLSELGLIQMTRKRVGLSLKEVLTQPCPECHGEGIRKSNSTMASEVLRTIKEQILLSKLQGKKVGVYVSPLIFEYLSKYEYQTILLLEKTYNVKLLLIADKKLVNDEVNVTIEK